MKKENWKQMNGRERMKEKGTKRRHEEDEEEITRIEIKTLREKKGKNQKEKTKEM